MTFKTFEEFFEKATGFQPYPYQVRLAQKWGEILEVPTGCGKTEAIVLGWLWRRRYADGATRQRTPRRLAYTLPMRVLVEQTLERVRKWLRNLGLDEDILVWILMGGEADDDWDIYPERDQILIGTQDMLLSRALNRGYAMSRYRWPVQFGLLNNDCQWVFDEVQLMGSGLATSAQLAAFREQFGVWGHCPSLWVSATLRPEWLATVDFQSRVDKGLDRHELKRSEWQASDSSLTARLKAVKTLARAKASADDPKNLAAEIRAAHQNGTLTLVVVNTVRKATALYEALTATHSASKRSKQTAAQPQLRVEDILLLHSRFRPPEREIKLKTLLGMEKTGGIVVATQVVEAGVDISACTLFTELSPWASFVQRVGRCNRKGEFKTASVLWIDVDTNRKGGSAPYTPEALEIARRELKALSDVGPGALHDYLDSLPEERRTALYPYGAEQVIRRRTIEDLFDTTPDLTGADTDISLYIRENDEHDIQIFWRTWQGDNPNYPELQAKPTRDELCPAPLNKDTRDWLDKQGCWRWDFLEGRWARAETVFPGQIYLISAGAGGYSTNKGFDPSATDLVTPLHVTGKPPEDNESDPWSTERKIWQTIAAHTNQVVEEVETILKALHNLLTPDEVRQLRHAARWHDWGKAYDVFQKALTAFAKPEFDLPDEFHRWAKSSGKSGRYEHPHFRHELASALGMLTQRHPDLACYLAAAHHGKVRASIRSLPNEKPAPSGRRFARGVWEGDTMPPVKLGGGVIAPEVTFSLAPMELGLGEDGQPSWTERVLQLLKRYGPFRLTYLEALLCAADRRASANPRQEVSND